MTPVFASVRERRLWWWTAAVVVAIYSKLGLARTLAGELRDSTCSTPPSSSAS